MNDVAAVVGNVFRSHRFARATPTMAGYPSVLDEDAILVRHRDRRPPRIARLEKYVAWQVGFKCIAVVIAEGDILLEMQVEFRIQWNVVMMLETGNVDDDS